MINGTRNQPPSWLELQVLTASSAMVDYIDIVFALHAGYPVKEASYTCHHFHGWQYQNLTC